MRLRHLWSDLRRPRDQTPGGLKRSLSSQPVEDRKEPKRSTSLVKKEAARSTSKAAAGWTNCHPFSNLVIADRVCYRLSHNIWHTLFFVILSASSLPKYKRWVSFNKFRKFSTIIMKIDSEIAEIFDVKFDILQLHKSKKIILVLQVATLTTILSTISKSIFGFKSSLINVRLSVSQSVSQSV